MSNTARNAVERAVTDAANAVLGPGWRPVDITELTNPGVLGGTTWRVKLRREQTNERVEVFFTIPQIER